MMSLSVIGAGFGRTGTTSMKLALEILGFGPCHHMRELSGEAQIRYWRAIAQGHTADWDKVFTNFGSCIDWPAAYFWRELSEKYPEAKIVLTLRSPHSWYKSMQSTILKVLKSNNDPSSVASKLIGERLFGNRLDDKNHLISLFEQNTRDLQATFSSKRLLSYEIGSGWEPLCKFLNKPIPNMPFPHNNSTEEFQTRMKNKTLN